MIAALPLADIWQRFWDNPMYPQALAGGLGIALACSVLSVFVVLKRMAFIGEGISHSAFGGFGAAVLAQAILPAMDSVLARDAIVAVFCVLTAVGIGWLSRRGKLSEDTAIGIALVTAMAVGVVMLNLRSSLEGGRFSGYVPPWESILFGDILFIGPQETWTIWALAGAIVLAVAALFKELVFFSFDEEAAPVFGVPAGAIYYGLLVALGLAVVAAIKSVGVILVGALLVVPGSAARLLSNRIGVVTLLSAALGVGGLAAGFFLGISRAAMDRNLSMGPVIVLTLVALLVACYAARAARMAIRRRGNAR
jgi:ABC-type Mn2+/Zn2+ transport system permease subunit